MIMSLGIIKIAVEFETGDLFNDLKKILIQDKKTNSTNNKKQQSELMCFLGLKDKNGKLIHFGDILTDNRNNLLTPVCEIENGEHILFFKPIQHLNKKMRIGCKSTYSNTLEIIGNIYNHSKLTIMLQQKGIYSQRAMEYCFINSTNKSYLQ